jgi:hypothetical protein
MIAQKEIGGVTVRMTLPLMTIPRGGRCGFELMFASLTVMCVGPRTEALTEVGVTTLGEVMVVRATGVMVGVGMGVAEMKGVTLYT